MTANAIHVGRYSDLLARLLSIEEKNPAGEIATEIFPVLALEVDRPEWYVLGGTLPAFGRTTRTNGGGFVMIMLRNPVDSGRIIVCTDLYAQGPAAALGTGCELVIGISSSTPSGTQGTAFISDTRAEPGTTSARPVGQVWGHDGGSVQAIKERQAFSATDIITRQTYKGPYVISPGFSVAIELTLAATALEGGFTWYERRFEPLEQLAG